MRIFAQLLNSIKRLSEAFNFNERKENGSQRFPGSQAKNKYILLKFWLITVAFLPLGSGN